MCVTPGEKDRVSSRSLRLFAHDRGFPTEHALSCCWPRQEDYLQQWQIQDFIEEGFIICARKIFTSHTHLIKTTPILAHIRQGKHSPYLPIDLFSIENMLRWAKATAFLISFNQGGGFHFGPSSIPLSNRSDQFNGTHGTIARSATVQARGLVSFTCDTAIISVTIR